MYCAHSDSSRSWYHMSSLTYMYNEGAHTDIKHAISKLENKW